MTILNTMLSAVVSLAVLYLLTRLMGNKQLSQLTAFDYIIGISIGSIAAEMASEPDDAIRPLVAMLLYGLADWGISLATNASPYLERRVSGVPQILMDGGRILEQNLKKARMGISEFLMLCRLGGYFDLSELESVIVEKNGKLSFIPRACCRPATPEDMAAVGMDPRPPQVRFVSNVIADGKLLRENLASAGKSEKWLGKELRRQGYGSPKRILLATLDDNGNLSVYRRNMTQKINSHTGS